MGSTGIDNAGAAINEAVFLLAQTSPERLESLRSQFPYLAEELQEGIYAGEETQEKGEAKKSSYLADKAAIVIAALDEAAKRAESAMGTVAESIRKARLRRLISQVLVLVGSSSLLGAVALEGKTATVLSAVLTLLAALGNLFAEHYERLINPQSGNIYDAFQKLGEGAYRARTFASRLQLALRHKEGETELANLIGEANELCEQLNGWLIQILNQSLSGRLAVGSAPPE